MSRPADYGTLERVLEIYAGVWGASADAEGADYWVNLIDNEGWTYVDVASSFFDQMRVQDMYEDAEGNPLSGDDFLTALYNNIFKVTEPDAEGFAFWQERMSALGVTDYNSDGVGTLAMEMIDGMWANEATVDTTQMLYQNWVEASVQFYQYQVDEELTPFSELSEADQANFLAAASDLVDDLDEDSTAEDIAAAVDEAEDAITPLTFELMQDAVNGQADEGSTVNYTVTASSPVEADTTFTWSVSGSEVSGSDFSTPNAGTVTIMMGETTGTFSIGLTSNDGAELSETYTVSVADVGSVDTTIRDTDHVGPPPVVEADQTISYAENQEAGAELGMVAATDDTGVTGYSIVSGNSAGYYAIDSSGTITLTEEGAAAALNDFETDPNTITLGVVAMDEDGNESEATDVMLEVTNADDDAPEFVNAVISGATLTLTYDETLDSTKRPEGTDFQVAEGTTGITVTSVNVSGSTVTLGLGVTPTGTTTVSYLPNPNVDKVLQDPAGNLASALTSQTATSDTEAPTLVSTMPADSAADVAVDSNIELTFSETVKAGTGNIVITNSGDASDTRTIDVTDTTQVTFSGATMTINPTADLMDAGSYTVTMDAGVVTDAAGNPHAGVTDTELNFSTPGGGGTGTLYNLTDSAAGAGLADNIPGTAGDDTITGGPTTLDNDDIINGAGGRDILRADLDGTTVAPTISNVEGLTFANAGFGGASLIFSNIQLSAATSLIFEIAGGNLSASQLPGEAMPILQNWAEGTTAYFSPADPGGDNMITLSLHDVKSAHLDFPSYETITLDSETGTNVVALNETGATAGLQNSATIVLTGTADITLQDYESGTTATFLGATNSGVIQGSAHEGVFALSLGSDTGTTWNLGNVEGADRVNLGVVPGQTAIGINGLTGGQDVYFSMSANGATGLFSGAPNAFDFNVRSAANTANTADAIDAFIGLCADANTTAQGFYTKFSGMTGVEVLNLNVTTAGQSAVLGVVVGGTANSAWAGFNSINFLGADAGLASASFYGADTADDTSVTALSFTALATLSFSGVTSTDIRLEGGGNSAATGAVAIHGGGGDDFIAVGSDTNSKYTIEGGAGNDTLVGAGYQTANNGFTAMSELMGTVNNGMVSALGDSIVGGAGNDWLIGGAGADTLVGGDGSDVFVFQVNTAGDDGALADASAGQQDLINDFATGDQIWLAFSGFDTAAAGFAESASTAAGGAPSANTSDAPWFGGTISAVQTASLTGAFQTGASALLLAIYKNGDNTFIEFTVQTATAANTNFNSAGDAFNRIQLAGYSSSPTSLKLEAFGSGILISVV